MNTRVYSLLVHYFPSHWNDRIIPDNFVVFLFVAFWCNYRTCLVLGFMASNLWANCCTWNTNKNTNSLYQNKSAFILVQKQNIYILKCKQPRACTGWRKIQVYCVVLYDIYVISCHTFSRYVFKLPYVQPSLFSFDYMKSWSPAMQLHLSSINKVLVLMVTSFLCQSYWVLLKPMHRLRRLSLQTYTVFG